jgi:hypothetical protein
MNDPRTYRIIAPPREDAYNRKTRPVKCTQKDDARMQCDHDDGDGLNNQRSNLFEVTSRGNNENLHIAKTSQFLGVTWHNACRRWQAQIGVKGKSIYLGIHATEFLAAQARESYIVEHPELQARSNFQMETP